MGETALRAKTVVNAIRPGIILLIGVGIGVYVGKENDNPIMGLALGLGGAAIVNGLIDYNDIRSEVMS